MRINVRHIRLANLAADEVEKFTLNIQNREIKPSAVKKVIKEVYDQESGTWNQVNPIQVNLVTGNVVEGQHRREGYLQLVNNGTISRDTTIPVLFIEVPREEEVLYIQKMNTGKGWTTEDHVKSQSAGGNENSRKLMTFCLEHELCHTDKSNGTVTVSLRAGAAILTGGRKEHNLRKGDFIFPEENRLLAETVHDELLEILSLFPTWTKGKANIEAMAKAWYEVRDRYPFKEWKKAIKKNSRGPMTMSSTAANSWKQYFYQCAGTIALAEQK